MRVQWTVILEMTGLGALHCVICSLVFIRTQWEVEYVYTIYVWTAAKSLQSCPTLCVTTLILRGKWQKEHFSYHSLFSDYLGSLNHYCRKPSINLY